MSKKGDYRGLNTYIESNKLARITSVFKGNSWEGMANYRIVSVLPVFSEIFGRLMFTRLYSFINKHNLFYKYQLWHKPGVDHMDR